ncbi:MAG: hypothetical protein LBE22_07100 [Azoarcus sp.]|jgi:hypothetical protein|nr:hypothetical protein [Azoarcus sp.]
MIFRLLFVLLLFFVPGPVAGQPVPDAGQPVPDATSPSPATATESDAASTTEPAPDASSGKGWRDTSGYPFPALADTVAGTQNMVHAMILREYCSNEKLPDDFVRNRLARFSRITGREEDCQSLLDYNIKFRK